MNNERDKPDSDDDDRLVSTTYREIANETAPAALNRSILSQAAAAAKPRYARSISWMRPMAWAATIGLSLAIVLEIMQVPPPESPVFEASIESFDSPAKDSRQRDKGISTGIVQESVQPEMPADKIAPDLAPKADAVLPVALQAPQPIEVTEKKRATTLEPAMELQKASAASVTDEFDPRNSSQVGSAEDLRRLQSGTRKEPAGALRAGAYASDAATSSVRSAGCDETAKATPAAWLECVEELENAGLSDAARGELEQMKQAFPEFVLP